MSENFESKDARMWAMLCHASSLLGYTGLPLANVLGPMVVWMAKRDSDPLVAANGLEALNFNITVLIGVLAMVLLMCTGIGAIIAIPGLIVIAIAHVFLTIFAAIKAYDGQAYRYPWALRLVKGPNAQ